MTMKEAASIVHACIVAKQERLAELLFQAFLELYGIDDNEIEVRFAEMCDKGV